jgi:hypothetical protein
MQLVTHESVSAIVMILFELGVLMRIFTRSASLFWPSVILAPTIAVLALRIAPALAGTSAFLFSRTRLDYAAVFLVAVLLELPLSLIGYTIDPPAKLLERLVVAGSFAVVSVMTAKSILGFL